MARKAPATWSGPGFQGSTHQQDITIPKERDSGSAEYTVTAQDADGCWASATQTVDFGSPPPDDFYSMSRTCCTLHFEADDVPGVDSVTWGGDLEEVVSDLHAWEINVSPASVDNMTLTFSNACGDTNVDEVGPWTKPTGSLPNGADIWAPSDFHINSGERFSVTASGAQAAAPANPFNACTWRFTVLNRWGTRRLYRKTGTAVVAPQTFNMSLPSGSFPDWDGRDDNGDLLNHGQYIWQLELANCTHGETLVLGPEWVSINS